VHAIVHEPSVAAAVALDDRRRPVAQVERAVGDEAVRRGAPQAIADEVQVEGERALGTVTRVNRSRASRS
jgi:hypothetical protein